MMTCTILKLGPPRLASRAAVELHILDRFITKTSSPISTMSPSRGLNLVLRSRLGFGPVRSSFRRYSEFVKSATNLSNKTQVYLSRIPDPFLNLSIEHYLLQKTPPDSTVLFLYTNEPCIVIGRNQNPWVEVNTNEIQQRENPIWLVRRRSGGGTVFHDEGNVNYSVIGPTAAFNRDKHAEMVVRALHELGVDKTRVNERHDIVLDKTHANGDTKAWKVSGSAYKLTRMRSLHHGTCLLNSPNLRDIRGYLHPYAAHCIEARGVASVSSPVCNVEVPNSQFEQAVVFEFAKMYGPTEPVIVRPTNGMMAVPEIGKGYDELRSPEWIYQQTPQFVFSDPQVDLGVSNSPRNHRRLYLIFFDANLSDL